MSTASHYLQKRAREYALIEMREIINRNVLIRLDANLYALVSKLRGHLCITWMNERWLELHRDYYLMSDAASGWDIAQLYALVYSAHKGLYTRIHQKHIEAMNTQFDEYEIIMNLIADYPRVTTRWLAAVVDVSPDVINRRLRTLRDKDYPITSWTVGTRERVHMLMADEPLVLQLKLN